MRLLNAAQVVLALLESMRDQGAYKEGHERKAREQVRFRKLARPCGARGGELRGGVVPEDHRRCRCAPDHELPDVFQPVFEPIDALTFAAVDVL